MVPVLTVREVVVGQIGTASVSGGDYGISWERHLPGEHDLVIESVELHVLQTPALIDSSRKKLFLDAVQVWRVVHTYLHSLGKLLEESSEQGRA